MMNTKIFTMAALAVLTLMFSFALVSASTISTDNIVVTPNPIDHDARTFQVSFDLTNTATAGTIDFTLVFLAGSGHTGTLTLPSIPLAAGTGTTPTIVPVTAVVEFDKHQSGTMIGAIIATDSGLNPGTPAGADFSVVIRVEEGLEVSEKDGSELDADGTGVLVIENTGNTFITGIELTTATGRDFTLTFTPEGMTAGDSFSLPAGEDMEVTVISTDIGSVGFNGKSVKVTATDGSITSNLLTVAIEGSFCSAGEQGANLDITDVKIDNRGEGSDDEWQLLDTIEIEVQVDNDGNADIKDVFIEIGLFDEDGDNQINDMEFENSDEEEFDVGKIRDGDDETVTFKFKVPADFEDGSYSLTVKAYSDDLGEDDECNAVSSDLSDDTFEVIDVEREDDEGKFLAFDDFVVSPLSPTCNERVSMTFSVFNIGDEDQEDRIRVFVVNSELNIDETIIITNDIDQGDKETVNLEFTIPQNAADKTYKLKLSADYDYNRGSYKESSDEETVYPLRVLGCVGGPSMPGDRTVVIGAVLDSDAVAGEELVVRTTITNLGSSTTGFVVDPRGFSSWASLESISQNVVELAPGESKDIILRFNVKDDADGEESFVIEVQAGGMTESREVVVNIDGAGGSSGGLDFGDNSYLWIIGIVNVILIILIIVVAVRISRR